MGTTAASVSYHVARLERQTGLALFDRHPQRVTLTATGADVAAELTRIFGALRATLASAANADSGRLSLSALPTFGTSWLTPRLGAFRAAAPDLSLELHLSDAPEPLGQGRFDAAVRNGHGDWPGLRATRLFPSVFTPLCSPALADAAGRVGDPRHRSDVPLLGRPDWWRRWYEAQGVTPPDLTGLFGTTLAAEHLDAAAAIAGHGITIGSPILFCDEIRAGRLVQAHPFVASDGRAFWFVHPNAHTRRSKLSRFRAWLLSKVSDELRTVPDQLNNVRS